MPARRPVERRADERRTRPRRDCFASCGCCWSTRGREEEVDSAAWLGLLAAVEKGAAGSGDPNRRWWKRAASGEADRVTVAILGCSTESACLALMYLALRSRWK